ncbi:MAG TPA: class I SAM-dependent methyltransferase [Candidatus Binatia bacterium]|nr:class I SAM-dependent methyltransferase [Candidatus Binatia bacterium]
MATKTPDMSETYLSRDKADQWGRGKQRRDAAFGPATEQLLDLAGVQAGSRVLDVAAGTGDSSLMAARRVGPSGHVLAVDISANMLKEADESAREAGLTNLDTRVMNAEKLELETGSFDGVICRIALMLIPDPMKALTEMHRVVKSGEKVAVMVFSAAEKNPYHSLPLNIVRRLGKIPSPAPGKPGMFALGRTGVLEDTYKQAGFRDVAAQAISILWTRASTSEAISVYKDSYAVLRDLMAKLSDADRELAWKEIEQKVGQFGGPNGVEVPGEVLIGVGTK